MKSAKTTNFSLTVEKALKILDLLAEKKIPMRISELSSSLGVNKSTTYRILQSLLARGYIIQDPRNSKYGLGYRILEISNSILQSLELRTVARPHLERLAIETSYTVGLAIMNNWEMVYLDQLHGTGVIRLEFRIGSRWPIHCTAAGKAYLAFQSEKEIDRFLSQGSLKRYTENTIVNVKKLKEELKNIKSQGYALNNAEYQKEVRAIGSPIFNLHKKAMATVVMAAPLEKIKKGNIQVIGKKVQKTAFAISEHMGFIE